MIVLKTEEQIEIMNEANSIVHKALGCARLNIKDGVSTKQINDIIESVICECGGKPTFKGYMGFPESSCISINNEVVHGIPRNDVIIRSGDVVSVDVGVTYDGFVGDSAITIAVGDVSSEIKNLIDKTNEALHSGIKSAVIGNGLHDISRSIESVALNNNLGNVIEYCGHGVGNNLHEDPKVFNHVDKNYPNIKLREGMTIAIEPMFVLGDGRINLLDDGWTVVADGVAAHCEFSIAITKDGPRILGNQTLC